MYCCYVYTLYNLFEHSSCTSLVILLFIKSRVYCPAHFILLHMLFFIIFSSYLFYFFNLYLCIFSCVVLHILHCPLSGPDLTYITLLIIFCIIEYVTNKNLESYGIKKSNSLHHWTLLVVYRLVRKLLIPST